MMRLAVLGAVLAALAGVSACGERPQTMSSGNIGDVAAFQGAKDPFVAPGWKPGDKSSWEQALKARMQNSQNEYSKTN
ncbi:MAG: hypothetical protein ABIQ90_07605 [Polaromonas sp.]